MGQWGRFAGQCIDMGLEIHVDECREWQRRGEVQKKNTQENGKAC